MNWTSGRAGWSAAICASLILVMAGAAAAQDVSAKAFVEAIYKPYLNKKFKGIDYSKPATLRRYFEPVLANAIIADMKSAGKRNEVPTLDGDPFIDAQDWEIDNLAVEVKAAGARKAVATVKYTNIREPKVVTLDLVNTRSGWRIAEMNAPSGSLRKLFKLK
jgi:hypothetical protein